MTKVSEEPEVKFIRLKNGDDVIAQVVEFSENDQAVVFALIHPLKVIYIPSQKGAAYLQVAFMPWVFTRICDEQEFMIHAEDVITMGNASSYMVEYYWNNLDHFVGSKEETQEEFDEPEVENTEEVNLEEILEVIKSSRRTYH